MNKIPKDRQIIIQTKMGSFAARWSGLMEEFVYANPQIDMYDGRWEDFYYENKHIKEREILSWREL